MSRQLLVYDERFRLLRRRLLGDNAEPLTVRDLVEPVRMAVEADKDRSDARRNRLSQPTPAIPDAIYWFMLITLAVAVLALAFCLPYRGGGTEIVTLLVVTALMTASLLIIRDVDRPFGGAITVNATSMSVTEKDISADFASTYGKGKLPCDAQGRAA
ncbi:hypothetical protein [Streptomyces sp. ODS28]|uniref:bestrophin-like domain n=1 Tax=Streptomyces sp. ODS28 TaxID=3136688 RepID=UPI0031EE7F20